MATPRHEHPFLDDYIISEYRYQDERAEQVYSRANWQIGVSALLGGAAFAARQPEAVNQWTSNVLAFLYVVSAIVLILQLAGVTVLIGIAIVPGRYATPGPSNGWLKSANSRVVAEDNESAASRRDIDAMLKNELSGCADENRTTNRCRFKWLNYASKLIALSAPVTVLHLLIAGLLHLTSIS